MGLFSLFSKTNGNENIRKAFKQLTSAELLLFQNSYTLYEETISDLIELFQENQLILGGISSIFEITKAYVFTLKECAYNRRPKHIVAIELSEKFPLFDHTDLIAKQFIAYCLIKASHSDYRLNQEHGRESIALIVKEIDASSARRIQSKLWRIVEEQNGSEAAYLEYLLANNPRNIPKEELKAFIGILVFGEENSKEDTVDAFKMYLEELIDATVIESMKKFTGLLDICSFFCGLLNANGIITEHEMKEISEEYTKIIVMKKMQQ